MSAAADEDYEHWPVDDKHWTRATASATACGSNNGFHQHSYVPPPSTAASPPAPPTAPSPLPPSQQQLPPQQLFYPPYPHVFWAHPSQQIMPEPQQPQYFSHPHQQAMYTSQAAPQGYYTYAVAPQPQAIIAPTPPMQLGGEGASFHVYQPMYSNPTNIPKDEPALAVGPPGNVWLGRTQAQVAEDDMKIAKREGAYDKRKIVPIEVKEEQIFWVVELDGSHSLREFRYIKGLTGTWQKDPRFEDSYYFVCDDEEEKKNKAP